MSEEIEIWKDIPNYEGLYQVSSFGRVKSFNNYRGTNERILMQFADRKGYLMSYLYKNNKRKTIQTHVLVAMAFLDHKPDGHKIVVDHIDNNKSNNHIWNLRLTTNRENCSKDRKSIYSSYTGVCLHRKNKWVAHIRFKERYIYLGLFKDEIDASNSYKKALKEVKQGLDLNVLYPKKQTTSKYKWVYYDKSRNKWAAEYKDKYIGRFNTEIEAYKAVQNYIESLGILV